MVTTGWELDTIDIVIPSISMRPNGPDPIGQWISPERLSPHTNARTRHVGLTPGPVKVQCELGRSIKGI